MFGFDFHVHETQNAKLHDIKVQKYRKRTNFMCYSVLEQNTMRSLGNKHPFTLCYLTFIKLVFLVQNMCHSFTATCTPASNSHSTNTVLVASITTPSSTLFLVFHHPLVFVSNIPIHTDYYTFY